MVAYLRETFPWPAERPGAPVHAGSMFRPSAREALRRVMEKTPRNRPIVELGSWVGDSAEWMVQQEPDSFIVCIDTWLGSNGNRWPVDRYGSILATLYDSFLARLWPYRERLTPVRADTLTGLRALKDHRVQPRFFYVDAGHERVGVYADVAMVLELFPGVPAVGDDLYPGNSVDQGVRKAWEESVAEGNLWVEPPMWGIDPVR